MEILNFPKLLIAFIKDTFFKHKCKKDKFLGHSINYKWDKIVSNWKCRCGKIITETED